jgi:transcriptional regulator with XRE-family HTH domain
MPQVTLAEKLRYLRKSRRMSQAELAHRLGLTNNAFISHLERGTRRPSGPMLRKLAELLVYDYESLRALAGPPPGEERQEELMPAVGADLTAKIRREVDAFGDRLGDLVGEALPEFLWSREQRLLAEGGSREIWIMAPAIEHHGVEEDLLSVAVSNLKRGARYRYLLSDQRETRIEAGRLLRRYDGAGDGQLPEVTFVSRDAFPLVFEIALFDPKAGDRIRGTLLPPGVDPEWEVALAGGQARELARHFARLWSRTASASGSFAG